MTRQTTPFEYWMLGVRTAQMLFEAQVVIAMRVMGMANAWPVPASENRRMFNEKWPAFTKASMAATTALMKGKRPDQIAQAALRPIGAKTRANSRRLSKRRRP